MGKEVKSRKLKKKSGDKDIAGKSNNIKEGPTDESTTGADYQETKTRKSKKQPDQEQEVQDINSKRIDDHTINYFKRVEKILEEDAFDDSESRELFMKNVLTQLGDGNQTCRLVKHRLISQVLERLLELSTSEHFLLIFKRLLFDVIPLCHDRFASHPIQTLLNLVSKHLFAPGAVSKYFEEIQTLVLDFNKAMMENCSELIRDTYGSHILSTLIQILSGIKILESITRSKQSRAQREKIFKKGAIKKGITDSTAQGTIVEESGSTNTDFCLGLHKLGKRILKDDNLGELMCHRNSSPVLQVLMLVSNKVDSKLCSQLCQVIIKKGKLLEKAAPQSDMDESGFVTNRAPLLFVDEIGSHLVEKLLHVASPEVYDELFSKCFQGNIMALSLHPLANYIVQHLLRTIHDRSQVEVVISELSAFLEDILAAGHFSVVVKMAEVCARFQCNEKELFKTLSNTFHLPKGKENRKDILKLLISMSTHEAFFKTDKDKEDKDKEETDKEKTDKDKEKTDKKTEDTTGSLTNDNINYHGACLVKILFQFEDSTRLVKSLLSLDMDEILALSRHEHGSFAVEGFLLSKDIPTNKKHEFLVKIQGKLADLACSKYGSHVLDKLWAQADIKHRDIIAKELIKDEHTLKGNMYGRIILRNCAIGRLRSPQGSSWQEKQPSTSNKRKHFENLFEDTTLKESVVENKKKKKVPEIVEKKSYRDELSLFTGILVEDENKCSNTQDESRFIVEGLHDEDISYRHLKNEIDDIFERGKGSKRKEKKAKN